MSAEASPRLVVIETSGRSGSIAVATGEEIRAVTYLDESRRHARDLAPVLATMLAEQHWKPRDVSAVIVSLGPGSYTGLRVGIMSAKAFAYATGCRLLGIDTFAVIAEQTPEAIDRVDVLADAQQEKIYIQSFQRFGISWKPTNALRVIPFATWLSERNASAAVSGPGLCRWAEQVPTGVVVAAETSWNPSPESLLRLGNRRYLAGERDDVYAVEPLYIRASSAEEQWARKKEV